MCLFLGNEACQCAGEEPNKKARNERLHDVAKVIFKRIESIDTTTKHKKQLLSIAESFLDDTKNKDISTDVLLYDMLRLCGLLLGFKYSGRTTAIIHSLFFWQNSDQYMTERIMEGEDDFKEKESDDDAYIISKKYNFIKQLNKEGFTPFKIAMIFNTSENQIKKIIKNI